MEVGADGQSHRAAARGVQAAHQDADSAALGRLALGAAIAEPASMALTSAGLVGPDFVGLCRRV